MAKVSQLTFFIFLFLFLLPLCRNKCFLKQEQINTTTKDIHAPEVQPKILESDPDEEGFREQFSTYIDSGISADSITHLAYIQKAKDIFTRFDRDKDGTIDIYELGFAMRSMGIDEPNYRLQRWINEFNKSGKLTFLNFYDMIEKKKKHLEDKMNRDFDNIEVEKQFIKSDV